MAPYSQTLGVLRGAAWWGGRASDRTLTANLCGYMGRQVTAMDKVQETNSLTNDGQGEQLAEHHVKCRSIGNNIEKIIADRLL